MFKFLWSEAGKAQSEAGDNDLVVTPGSRHALLGSSGISKKCSLFSILMAPGGLGSDFQICFILSMSEYILNRSIIVLMKMTPAFHCVKIFPKKVNHRKVSIARFADFG